ncbi:MAG: hypothetical protein JST80_11545 [Bdellovibrionales bacterium]|nr:hypothetical protein [Bdellovibrionales bacterium]
MNTNQKRYGRFIFFALALGFVSAPEAHSASPTIDTFNVQSYIRLTSGSATSATSANFVFGVFKGTTCIWAKRYSSVSINAGVINQNLSGAGSNISSISNGSATAGECVADFTSVTLNSTLLMTGVAGALNLRVYSETSLDGFQPIWDVPFSAVPSAMVADQANNATNATSAADLVSGMKVTASAGTSSMGKFPILDSSGKLDNTFINQTGLTVANTQVSGLGTAALANTGTSSGNVPVLNVSGLLTASVMPTYTANRVMATDGSGVMSGSITTTTTSAGAGDVGKIALLNSSGKIDNTAIDSTALTPNPANLSSTVAVNKGGTGQATLTANNLLVGNGTSAVAFLAPTNGNIVAGSGGAWVSSTADSAGIVDQSSAQTIGGNKTFIGNTTMDGTMTFGTGGASFSKILNCSIASTLQVSGTAKTGTCTGATTGSVAMCSPTVAPATAWIVAASRISAANTVYVMPYRAGGGATWTTAYNCVVFVP